MRTNYNITTLNDWYNEWSYNIVEAITAMREDVQNNNTVIIEQRYNNSPSEELYRFYDLDLLNQWISKQFPDIEEIYNLYQ